MKTTYSTPPSLYNAYHICKRQAWLMHRQLTADQQNTFLDIGRLIDETTYEREKKKIYLADMSAMIDMVTKKDGEYCIAEIKKTSKRLENGILQLKYYLYILRKKYVNIKGIIKIPKEKKSITVELQDEDVVFIEQHLEKISELVSQDAAPPKIERKICAKCAHFEFCWA